MSTCTPSPSDPSETQFIAFTKNTGKIFVIMTALSFVLILKARLVGSGANAFSMALFVVVSTLLVSLIGLTDTFILSNILMGLGLGLGISIFSPVSGLTTA